MQTFCCALQARHFQWNLAGRHPTEGSLIICLRMLASLSTTPAHLAVRPGLCNPSITDAASGFDISPGFALGLAQ